MESYFILQVSIPFNASTKINSGFVFKSCIACVTPFLVAFRILSSSISCLSIIATDQLIAFSIISSYNFSLFFSETFLESFIPSIIESSGIITHPITTGPASGPLPASSIPAIYFIPFL